MSHLRLVAMEGWIVVVEIGVIVLRTNFISVAIHAWLQCFGTAAERWLIRGLIAVSMRRSGAEMLLWGE